ncbi:MAG: imidazoleglycerol-phosphate dehydratase HisB [Clostridia bacterium]|nr:imidazoleglycerol-phosphate dehydratase HisB [Clostridia bacterium]
MRQEFINRQTAETRISVNLSVDGTGSFDGSSGIGFFDHMLNSFAVHGGFDIVLSAKGDLNVDCHHTVEDIGIVLGKAFYGALGDKRGIARFGSCAIPMDEALARAVVDISGRPYLVFDAEFKDSKVGEFDTCLTEEFFRAFAFNAGITLHLALLYGSNSHHCIEALFKSSARALKAAVKIDGESIPSTKDFIE